MSDKYAVISNAVDEICQKMTNFGYKLIYSDCVDEFISYERCHADMQCIKVQDKVFVLSQCKKLKESIRKTGLDVHQIKSHISSKYPENIVLNTKIIEKNLIGKIDCLDKELVAYCVEKGYRLINVNQGYTACSIAAIGENAAITADSSIYNALKKHNIDVLKISDKNILLHNAKREEAGFIGGASVTLDKENILFFGNIKNHPDYKSIKDFCDIHGVTIHCIKNIELTDIGGCVLLNI